MTGLAIAMLTLVGVTLLGTHRTHAATCTTNDIIKCGVSSPSDFISTVRSNNNGVNNMADLQAIYAHYGLTAADYDNFASHAVQGEAMRDGRIIVNGQVVGTGGMSIGRLKSFQGSSPFTVNIAGHDYFGNVNSQVFAAGVNEIPVYVMLDSSGMFKFAVMPSCGNPEFPKAPVKTSAACQVLNKRQVEGKSNTFAFTAAAAKTGNATITKFVYNFGDGSPSVTEMSGSTAVTHTYASSGTFTASVTVFANIPGHPDMQLPAVSMCTKQIVISPPPAAPEVACKLLLATPAIDNKLQFTFLATAQVTAGATLASADFDFGDGNMQTGVQPNGDGLSASVDHTYATTGTFTAVAVLHFIEPNGEFVISPACTAVVSPVAPTATSPPPPSSPPPAVTTALPNTGAGDTIGIFIGSVATGTAGYWLFVRRRLGRH